VEGWIRRAASRCAESGFEALAKSLNQHAQAESVDHLMMIADVYSTPESLLTLVAAGTAALEAYAEFLSDCVALAQRHYSAIINPLDRPSRSVTS
jgi:hypothetical protein